MTGITLALQGAGESRCIAYEYRCREDQMAGEAAVAVVQTKVTMQAAEELQVYYKEGYAFSPMFTLGLKKEIGQDEEVTTWLKLEKAN